MCAALSSCRLGARAVTTIEDRTVKALGARVLEQLRSLHFCILGCGGTGANFAEMLVRTGARNLTLTDGARVDASHLNRVFSFCSKDVGMPKVQALKRRLESIRDDLQIFTYHNQFRESEVDLAGDSVNQEVRDAVCDADIVFIATDTNRSRIAIVDLCRTERKKFLSCGVEVDPESGVFWFECRWFPSPPRERPEAEGYGPENASFASIVVEATSVAFTMLLSHLMSEDSKFNHCRRRYDAQLSPAD